jgi:hypothetical protein
MNQTIEEFGYFAFSVIGGAILGLSLHHLSEDITSNLIYATTEITAIVSCAVFMCHIVEKYEHF